MSHKRLTGKTTKRIIIFLIVIVLGAIFFKEILLHSYVSLVASCNPEQFNEQFNDTYTIVGQVAFTFENGTVENVTVNLGEDKNTNKHELVHLKQLERNPSWLICENRRLKYLSEVEAYIMSNLPDVIFNKLYL